MFGPSRELGVFDVTSCGRVTKLGNDVQNSFTATYRRILLGTAIVGDRLRLASNFYFGKLQRKLRIANSSDECQNFGFERSFYGYS